MDYAAKAAMVKRLIEKNGREFLLRKPSSTPTNAAQPWRGSTAAPTEVTVTGIVLDYDLEDDLSDLVQIGDKLAMVAADSTTEDLRGFTIVIDQAETWQVKKVSLLQPGDTPLLWELQLRK